MSLPAEIACVPGFPRRCPNGSIRTAPWDGPLIRVVSIQIDAREITPGSNFAPSDFTSASDNVAICRIEPKPADYECQLIFREVIYGRGGDRLYPIRSAGPFALAWQSSALPGARPVAAAMTSRYAATCRR
ncbi:hypothetical protein GCM10010401_11370 [Rarobacter faecitabidus]